ncbi:MAG: molybdopterin synthase subunit MoaD [Polaromonas sp.]|nr:molybdopterin synthase subunit MoaD [Polaromonas sp.]
MKVTIKYFASIREAIGHGSESRETAASSLAGLRDELLAASPGHAASLARGRAVRMALDQVMQGETAALHEGCEVAFFPPVTGG